MKKALANTRVSVKLRKSEYREEWYLYVEAYPVFQADKPTPQRVREYLNRTITTPIWDKSRNARTDKDGKTTYKPKRDLNGIIQCKSQLDQESCILIVFRNRCRTGGATGAFTLQLHRILRPRTAVASRP